MANSEWINFFPSRIVKVLAACNLDHWPLLLTLMEKQKQSSFRNDHFRYEACWGLNRENKEVIKKIWKAKDTQPNVWTRFLNKLDYSKKAMT